MENIEANCQRDVSEFVRREVIYCVSGLISGLCSIHCNELNDELMELVTSRPDYESAALEAGWTYNRDVLTGTPNWSKPGEKTVYLDAESVCDGENLEPEYHEIYEHWIVSDWLADKLLDRGETVVKDFMGLTVWGRCTTGQAISMDSVIQDIYNSMHREAA
jgi:hypothetical protein